MAETNLYLLPPRSPPVKFGLSPYSLLRRRGPAFRFQFFILKCGRQIRGTRVQGAVRSRNRRKGFFRPGYRCGPRDGSLRRRLRHPAIPFSPGCLRAGLPEGVSPMIVSNRMCRAALGVFALTLLTPFGRK